MLQDAFREEETFLQERSFFPTSNTLFVQLLLQHFREDPYRILEQYSRQYWVKSIDVQCLRQYLMGLDSAILLILPHLSFLDPDERVQIDWQLPLSGVHSIMMVNSAQYWYSRNIISTSKWELM